MARGSGILHSVRQIAVLLIGAGVVLFAYVNSELVMEEQSDTIVNLLFDRVAVPTTLLVLVPLLLGLLLGWAGSVQRRRITERKRADRAGRRTAKPEPATADAAEAGGRADDADDALPAAEDRPALGAGEPMYEGLPGQGDVAGGAAGRGDAVPIERRKEPPGS